MTYIESLHHNLNLSTRLLETITKEDLETKEGKKLYAQFMRRINKCHKMIKSYHWEPDDKH